MGMNEDRLSAGERAAMRATIVDGARTVRPIGARRAMLIGGIVAVLVVGGISGGAVATASFIAGADGPTVVETEAPATTTPEATPTPTPTSIPTPTHTPDSAEGPVDIPDRPQDRVVAFGGDCAAALSDDAAAELTGVPMQLAVPAWNPDTPARLGGMECTWLPSEQFLGARVSVWVYPADVASAVNPHPGGGCSERRSGGSGLDYTRCSTWRSADGTWISLDVQPDLRGPVTIDRLDDLMPQAHADIMARAAGRPAPRAESLRQGWWQVGSCEQIVDELQAANANVLPAEFTARRYEDPSAEGTAKNPGGGAGLTASCWDWEGSGRGFDVWAGGAEDFEAAMSHDSSVWVRVPGALAAGIAPSTDIYEGHYSELIATDGVNLVGLFVDGEAGPREEDIALLSALLTVLAD